MAKGGKVKSGKPSKGGKPPKREPVKSGKPPKGGKVVKIHDELEVGITGRYAVKDRGLGVKVFCDDINKALGGDGKVVTGDQVKDLDFRKEVTGNPAVDFVTNGGLIRGGASCGWGPEKSLKTTSVAHMVKNFQARGMACALASIETFDRGWWRRVGVFITYGSEEIDALPRSGKRDAARYNDYFEKKGTIPLTLFVHANAVRVLDMVIAGSRSNIFDFIVSDSLGAVMSIADVEGKSLEDPDFAGNSILMSRFAAFLTTTFNYKFDETNVYRPTGAFDNQTIVYCINQARTTIGTKAKMRDKILHPPGGHALRHLWNQCLFWDGETAEDYGDYVPMDGRQVKDVLARAFRVKGVKMRGGPEQRQADIDLVLKRRVVGGRVWNSGQLDVYKSLRAVSHLLGIIDVRGPSQTYKGAKFNGKAKFEVALQDDVGMYQELYTDMIAAAKLDALSESVPTVWE